MSRVGRWLRTNWFLIAAAAGLMFAVAVCVAVITSAWTSRDALDASRAALATRDDTAARASARITSLTDEIHTLEGSAQSNGQRIGELVAEVHTLESQVRSMGGRPIVTEPATTTTAAKRETTTTTARPSSTASTTAPQPPPTSTTTTTSRPCRTVPVVGRCVP